MINRKSFLGILIILFSFLGGFLLRLRPIYGQTPTPKPKNDSEEIHFEEQMKVLRQVLKILFSSSKTTTEEDKIPYPSSFPSQPTPSPSSNDSKVFSSLREIFNEVGQNTGVPPLILEAVMEIETPSTFKFSPNQIKQYSQPGGVIPGCGPNVCAATGPMQMTIGVDNNGNPLCPQCCWQGTCRDAKGGCPNAWRSYGSGNPCNLKDNIYGAARKLKNDSGAQSPTNWTQEQVYRAARRYYGDCTVAYSRLGNRTYCQYVWWYYNTR